MPIDASRFPVAARAVCLAILGFVCWTCSRTGVGPKTHTKPTASERETEQAIILTRVQAQAALCSVYEQRDLDCDKRITILDERSRCGRDECGVSRVQLGASSLELGSQHQAAQLATELAEGLLAGSTSVTLQTRRVTLDPVSYLRLRIHERYWDGLTRVIAPSGQELLRVLRDPKQGSRASSEPDWCAIPRCKNVLPGQTQSSAPAPSSNGSSERLYLYTPASDPAAQRLYANANGTSGDDPVVTGSVPTDVTAEWVHQLTRTGAHGLLTLAYDDNGTPLPFVVPGGRFNEMYGWDSYFISVGLLQSAALATSDAERNHFVGLAKAMAEHQAYQLQHYGKILNANRSYYLLRSQPPLFAPLLGELHATQADGVWTRSLLEQAKREYRAVWSAPPRVTSVCEGDVCLARYSGQTSGSPPEVEPGHFASAFQTHAIAHGHCKAPGVSDAERSVFLDCVDRMVQAYETGAQDEQLDTHFEHDTCVRESGHDTTFRWFVSGQERCADFVTVDLNALLFRYELEVAKLLSATGGAEADAWCQRAKTRARLVQRYLWSEAQGMFVDYDFVRSEQSRYVSATTLYPLWASIPNSCGASLVTPGQAQRLVHKALALLEAPGGLMATAPSSRGAIAAPATLVRTKGGIVLRQESRQWEAPNGWAPHQMMAWEGLKRHGFVADAERLAYRWMHMIASNAANYHGTVPEKFDVVARSHQVFAEYGNVNTDFAYIAREGFGWMNASFLLGWRLLPGSARASLRRLEPPPPVRF